MATRDPRFERRDLPRVPALTMILVPGEARRATMRSRPVFPDDGVGTRVTPFRVRIGERLDELLDRGLGEALDDLPLRLAFRFHAKPGGGLHAPGPCRPLRPW